MARRSLGEELYGESSVPPGEHPMDGDYKEPKPGEEGHSEGGEDHADGDDGDDDVWQDGEDRAAGSDKGDSKDEV